MRRNWKKNATTTTNRKAPPFDGAQDQRGEGDEVIRLLAWLRARYEKECAESDAQYREWQRIHDPFGFAIEESKAKSKEG